MTSDDTGERVGDALVRVRDGLATLGDAQWDAPSLCAGWSVKDALAHLVWRIGTPARPMLEDLVSASISGRHVNPMRSMADIARSISDSRSSGELLDDLTLLSRRFSTGDQRASSAALLETVVHGFDAAHPVGVRLEFDSESSFAVARLATRTASRQVRTVLRHRLLTAKDAGWAIGSGDNEIVGTAESVILYVTGRRSIDPGTARSRVLAPLPPGAPAPGLA
ncbi:TIGR03083 family protein [Paramicrobacterium humi]|uniref:TIGR03083 family protein n=1 Tax=Paramicrobacterium humi TaxID=640635 RepID=A0A1H4PK90_9MICO|nr:maleylpyruvate isomerase family mycothiol-dependent enzyme [Microbacterium humi]SEC07678.1 TIGR03083 family protein [Microbacterium humi]